MITNAMHLTIFLIFQEPNYSVKEKEKEKSLDVQAAQLEVLQHQKEKLILQAETLKVEKEKLKAEKLHYGLLNKKLLKDISLEN